jgi:hypothetical protein
MSATLTAPAVPENPTPVAGRAEPAAPGALGPAELDAFARDGYLPGRPLLEADELPALRAEYDRLVAEAAQELGGTNQGRRMLQVFNAGHRSALFHRLRHLPRMLAVLQDLLGARLALFHDQLLFKPAHDGGVVPWHQDNGYWRCRPANLVSCWLALDHADADNGTMQVIPGSHLAGAEHRDHGAGSRLFESQVDARRAVTVAVPAGWGMFHHCQTLHHTGPNDSPRDRRAFAVHVMAPGTRDGEGRVMALGYDHPLLCSD